MENKRMALPAKVHKWMKTVGFRLNSSSVNIRSRVITKHYFFETFNFLETVRPGNPAKSKFLCFDPYGEKLSIKSFTDLQMAFYDNLSRLK